MSGGAFLNADLPSEDEEDEDFVADEVDSDEERVAARNRPKPKRKAGRVRGAAAGAGVGEDDAEEEEEEAGGAPAEPEHKRAEKKARVDNLWSKLNAGKAAPAGGAASLAALCRPVPRPAGSAAAGAGGGADALLRQLGLAPAARPTGAAAPPADRRAVAAAALAAAKQAASVSAAAQLGRVTVTETRRFAGQEVTLQRDVAAGSKAAASSATPAAGAAKPQSGLDAVLASLAAAKKATTLDKTRSDWREFKAGDGGVEAELEAHKRSGAAYLEKQAFLKQAELAEYERERDQRLNSDVRNRGRL